MNDSPSVEAEAISRIYKELGSWPKVALYLRKYSRQSISSALAWRVCAGQCRSDRVTQALVSANLIEAPPPKVVVHVCRDCGQLHKMNRTCPTTRRKNGRPRRRRAWAGSEERAVIVDRMVESLGFKSLSRLIDHMVDDYSLENGESNRT